MIEINYSPLDEKEMIPRWLFVIIRVIGGILTPPQSVCTYNVRWLFILPRGASGAKTSGWLPSSPPLCFCPTLSTFILCFLTNAGKPELPSPREHRTTITRWKRAGEFQGLKVSGWNEQGQAGKHFNFLFLSVVGRAVVFGYNSSLLWWQTVRPRWRERPCIFSFRGGLAVRICRSRLRKEDIRDNPEPWGSREESGGESNKEALSSGSLREEWTSENQNRCL